MRESTLSRRVVESSLVVPTYSTIRRKTIFQTVRFRIISVVLFLVCFMVFLAHTQQTHVSTTLITGWNGLPSINHPTEQVEKPTAITKQSVTASQRLMRLDQTDPTQYAQDNDYRTWWPSACSATSMTMVIDSYGHNYHIMDIVHYEQSIGEITPDQGLMSWDGIHKTVAHFGFQTRAMNSPSIQNVVDAGNNGTPVIIGFPPEKWIGGHILVVLGGKSIDSVSYVHLADSSRLNMQWMTYDKFASYWGGLADIVTPL